MSRPVLRSHRGFVLHGLFDVPFAEIAPIVGRTPVGRRSWPARPPACSRRPVAVLDALQMAAGTGNPSPDDHALRPRIARRIQLVDATP